MEGCIDGWIVVLMDGRLYWWGDVLMYGCLVDCSVVGSLLVYLISLQCLMGMC